MVDDEMDRTALCSFIARFLAASSILLGTLVSCTHTMGLFRDVLMTPITCDSIIYIYTGQAKSGRECRFSLIITRPVLDNIDRLMFVHSCARHRGEWPPYKPQAQDVTSSPTVTTDSTHSTRWGSLIESRRGTVYCERSYSSRRVGTEPRAVDRSQTVSKARGQQR